jgi:hypothetical protein
VSKKLKSDLIVGGQFEKEASILEGFLRREALAKMFGVTTRTLNNWTYCPDGIPYVRIGQRVYYRMEDVRAWIAARVQRPVRTRRQAQSTRSGLTEATA